MSDKMTISFLGPFSWPGTPDAPSLFDVDEGQKPGIYLWTVPLSEGYIVYYVGETGRSFAGRMAEHYKEHAAGLYHVWSPTEFARVRRSNCGRATMTARVPDHSRSVSQITHTCLSRS